MIRFDHVSKSYKGTPRPALDDITTEILRGEFVFVVGASGSGKSTFLRLVLREERATRGKLHVLGQNLSSISNRKVPYFRRNVGVVFQDFRLLTNKTVFDNVAFTLQVIGKSKGFIHEAVPDVLAMVGLEGKGQRFPHELSGGEQQRVAIARAVVNKPQILLADEPTGNLDPATSAGITAVLERINASGTTVLMATHEAGLVDRMQKRVIELVGGQLVRDERHGGYGFTAAIPVLDEHGRAEVPRAYGAEDESARHPVGAGVAASATHVSARGAKPSRAERKAEKKAAKDASRTRRSERAAERSVQNPTAPGLTAMPVATTPVPRNASGEDSPVPPQVAPAQEAVAEPAAAGPAAVPVVVQSPTDPTQQHTPPATAAERMSEAPERGESAYSSAPQHARPRVEREPVPAGVPRGEPAGHESVLDGHFANPPTSPVRRADADVAELTLAERLGLRAAGKHDHEDDSNQDVGPVS
ncbi:hypothetical protein GCM10028798_20160 [Humibacter antri]